MLRGGEPPLLGTGVGEVLGPLCGLVCCRLCVGVISRCSGRPSRSVPCVRRPEDTGKKDKKVS